MPTTLMPTTSLAELIARSRFVIETTNGSTDGPRLTAEGRKYAAGLADRAPGTGVLISVANPITALSVALGAWWAGLRVAFTRADSPLSASQQAEMVHAQLEVVDECPAEDRAVSQRRGDGLHRRSVSDLRNHESAPIGPRCRAGDAALDLLTSGTTGTPKCIVMSHAGMLANACALAAAMGLDCRDRLWTSLPHGSAGVLATVILAAAVTDSTSVLAGSASVLSVTAALRSAAPTVVYTLPEVYEALSRSSRADRDNGVRWWLSSSSALTADRFDRMQARWGAVVRSFYCASELGTVTFNADAEPDSVRTAVGRPLPGVRLRIEPAADEGHDDRRVGRIVVGGDLVASGVRVGAGVRAFPADGIETTDRGYLDRAGNLVLAGRAADRLHVGSEVIDPALIEATIATHPAVAECIVVATPHAMLGSTLQAQVVRRVGIAVSERDILLACRASGLRGGWVPRSVRWITAVPRTVAGRPDRG